MTKKKLEKPKPIGLDTKMVVVVNDNAPCVAYFQGYEDWRNDEWTSQPDKISLPQFIHMLTEKGIDWRSVEIVEGLVFNYCKIPTAAEVVKYNAELKAYYDQCFDTDQIKLVDNETKRKGKSRA